MSDNCCDNCCTCACCGNCCLKCWLFTILTIPVIVMTFIYTIVAIISNTIFGVYYALIGWTCETSCCCKECYCKNCFADSMKFPWNPLRFFCQRIADMINKPLIEERDVVIRYTN